MDWIDGTYFIPWPFLCGILLLIVLAAISFCAGIFWRLKRAENVVNAAKRETMDAGKILYNTPYPLVHYVPHERILFSNPAALKAFPDLLPKGLAHPVIAGLDEIMSQGERRHAVARECEYEGIFYHQSVIPVESMGRKSVILYCYDISVIKRVQTALEDSRKQAEKANDAKSDFLANMSHELRTPMNGIIGLSGLLQEADIGGKKNTALAEAIHSSSRALLVLLNDILDFSKIEAGELTLESIPFSPARILQQIENLQRPAASRKNLSFTVETAPDVPAFLQGDPVRLQQILNNLLSNAIKFTEKGTITALCSGATSPDGIFRLHLEISDTGIGIPASKQEKIFTKFTQADVSTARKYGGTGLGLSITKHLVSMMKGTLSLESAEGKGSTFRVTIPLEIAERSPEKTSMPLMPDDVQFKGRLLIVDDHPTNILFLRSVLERMGLDDIDEATTGLSALTYALHNAYDLILMDCQMPDMDGREVSRRIRSSSGPSRSAPIIALTANAMKGAAEKCLEAGMDDYLSKPVEHTRLIDVIGQYLEKTAKAPSSSAKTENAADHHPAGEKEPNVLKRPLVFDWSRLEEFTGKDSAATGRIIDTFLEQMEGDTALLTAAFQSNDYALWKRTAHKLYGACANVGADALSVICDRVHAEILHNSDIKTIHAEILKEYRRLSEFLTQKEAA